MSIQSEINRIKKAIADTYAILEAKGATMPTTQNADNLPATADSIQGAEAAYTNLVPLATEYGSNAVYNGTGYKNGVYISSGSAPYEGTDSATVATGYIPYAVPASGVPDTIYIKGAEWATISHCRLYFFDENKAVIALYINGNITDVTNGGCLEKHFTKEVLGDKYYKLTPIAAGSTSSLVSTSNRVSNTKYIRLSLKGTGENLIVTVGEPIEGGGVLAIKKLWENSAPTNAFAAQTVSLDLSEYDGISIYFKNKNNSTVFLSTGIIPVGGDFTLFYITSDPASQRRAGSVSTTGVTFATGYAGSTTSTACAIPVIIYGYKGIT